MNLTKLRKEIENIKLPGGFTFGDMDDFEHIWSFIEHSLQEAVKEEVEEIADDIKSDPIYPRTMQESLEAYFEVKLDLLTQKPKGKI